MDAEGTPVEGTRRGLAVGDAKHRAAGPVPGSAAGYMPDMSGPADQVERLPERDRRRGPRHDRAPGKRGVIPSFEPNRVAAPGGQGPDGLFQGLAIEVDRDERRTFELLVPRSIERGTPPSSGLPRAGLLRVVEGRQCRGSQLLQGPCRFLPLDAIGRAQELDQLRRAGIVAEGRSRDDREGEDLSSASSFTAWGCCGIRTRTSVNARTIR